jgi:SAM-dependent methyltransferase
VTTDARAFTADDAALMYDIENTEWVLGTAAGMGYDGEFDLVVMVGNAFQCLAADEDLRASLAAIRQALVPGGAFAFGTRHLQAWAWERWNPSNAGDATLPDGTPLRVATTTLRFHRPETLNPLLVGAGFGVESQYGDWHRGPLDGAGGDIITIAWAQ